MPSETVSVILALACGVTFVVLVAVLYIRGMRARYGRRAPRHRHVYPAPSDQDYKPGMEPRYEQKVTPVIRAIWGLEEPGEVGETQKFLQDLEKKKTETVRSRMRRKQKTRRSRRN